MLNSKDEQMENGNRINNLLIGNPQGLTITDLVKLSKLSRSTVRNILSNFEGAKIVLIKKIGMAKIYTLKSHHGKN